MSKLLYFMFILFWLKPSTFGKPKFNGKRSPISHLSNSFSSLEEQVYYMSEYEYKPISLDDYLLDYSFHDYLPNCNPEEIEITKKLTSKQATYQEDSIDSPLLDMIIFASQYSLKVNCIGLLSNNTIVSFIDDATRNDNSSLKNSTKLMNIISLLIDGQDFCSNLHKTSSVSFIFECLKSTENSSFKEVTLFTFSGDDFSVSSGIDLKILNRTTKTLIFDPLLVLSKSLLQNQTIVQEFLGEYENCVRETSYYKNETSNTQHYFRYCKFHETDLSQKKLAFTEELTSFFEKYDLSLKDQIIKGIFPAIDISDFLDSSLKLQGAQQYADPFFVILDYNNGLLIFKRVDGIYVNIDYFIKYYYDLKYLNLFQMINLDQEFTIQDSVPNYLVINAQSYLLYYELELPETGFPDYFLPYPNTVSINYFLNQIKAIHARNQDQNSNSDEALSDLILPDLSDLNSFKSVKFTFDSYLYYIEVTCSVSLQTYYLLIYRTLIDNSTDINLDPQSIEVDYLSLGTYSRMFHYPIQGLFYSNIRTRVRLFEQSQPSLSITTYSWQSAQVLNLQTQAFDYLSSCNITLFFIPKQGSNFQKFFLFLPFFSQGQALGTKQMNLNVNLVPLNFRGVISVQGQDISLNFSNLEPIFQISNWLFGPAVTFSQNYTCSSKYAAMNIIHSSVTRVIDSVEEMNSEDEKSQASKLPSCEKILCQEKLIAAIQAGQSYYIFHQDCNCKFWYEVCVVNTQMKNDLFSIEFNRELNNTCLKSNSSDIKGQVDQLIFDGENILFSTFSHQLESTNELTQFETNSSESYNQEQNFNERKLHFMKISETLQSTNVQDNNNNIQDKQKNLQDSHLHNQEEIQRSNPKSKIKTNQSTIKTKKIIDRLSQNTAQKLNASLVTKELSFKDFSKINSILTSILDLQIFCIPNTDKYAIIGQSNTTNSKVMAIFRVQEGVKDLQTYTWKDDSSLQDSYDVSLLDEGILFSSKNANLTSQTEGYITVYKVNFLTNEIILDTIFTKQDMIGSLQNTQLKSISQEVLLKEFQNMNLQKARELKINKIKERRTTFIDNVSTFMINFSVKVWRNDETQPYRLLLIDYENNCLFDYFLYDLIQPVFVRQIDLFNLSISSNQLLQITNDMMSFRTTLNEDNYLVSIQIDGQSIDQIKKVQKIGSGYSYTQVQQSLLNPYSQGTLCGVFQQTSLKIKCLFNPYIQLNFDLAQNSDMKGQAFNQNSSISDKQVNFKMSVYSDLNDTLQSITLHTNFSNFDTTLLNFSSSIPMTYVVQNGTSLRNSNKQKPQSINVLPLNTSFAQGSIEEYYIDLPDSQIDVLKNHSIAVLGYVDTINYKSSILDLSQKDNIKVIDRNPYQLVGLTDYSIIVINQNLNFKFDVICKIKYSEIKILTHDPIDHYKYPYTALNCTNIFSNEVSSSQSTSTYLYLIQCTIATLKYDQYISFTVDVNHFGSLEDQKFDWQRAMENNVRLAEIKFSEADFDEIISCVSFISILSLTDEMNNVGAYIFLLVRDVQVSSNTNNNGDDVVYILWGENNIKDNKFELKEIDQIISPDFELNYLQINNFQASFPSTYPHQMRINLDLSLPKRPFVFNIGWDDGQRYVFFALLKINLPPEFDKGQASQNYKEIFSIQYEDIQSTQFQDFIKYFQTWKNPFTKLYSRITFFDDSYDASALITNEFSIIEFQSSLSPTPYLGSGLKEQQFNTMQNVSIYTQYAWCENQFNVDDYQQQILKYDNILLIECKSQSDLEQEQPQILKVYIIQDENGNSNNNIENNIKYDNLQSPQDQKMVKIKSSPQTQNQQYSMVQAIQYGSGKSIVSMSFRSDNQILYLDLILNCDQSSNYQLHQYQVNPQPVLLFSEDVPNELEINVCVKNKYTPNLCNAAVFSNVIVDTNIIQLKQWLKFSGLVAVPMALSITFIFISFVAMKKLRKKRQIEFSQLLENQNSPRSMSKSNQSSFPPHIFSSENHESKNDSTDFK